MLEDERSEEAGVSSPIRAASGPSRTTAARFVEDPRHQVPEMLHEQPGPARSARRRTAETSRGSEPVTQTRPAAVVVLAAGSGTRMKSKTMKVLHPVCGRSMIGHVVTAALAVRPDHLVAVVGNGR